MVPIYGNANAQIAKMGCVVQDRNAPLLLMFATVIVANAALNEVPMTLHHIITALLCQTTTLSLEKLK